MGFLRGLADWFRNNIPVIGPPIADAIEGIERGIEDWARRLWEAADAVFTFFSRLWISVSEAASRFATLVQDWWWRISWFFSELWNNVVAFFGWAWDQFRNWVSDRIREFSDWLNGTGKWLSDTLSGLKKAWEEFVKDPWGTIQKAINQIWSTIYDRVKPFLDEINGRINDVRNWFNDRIRELSSALDSARRELDSRINELRTWAADAISDLGKRFSDFSKWATDFLNSLKSGLEELVKSVSDAEYASRHIWEATKEAAKQRGAKEVVELLEKEPPPRPPVPPGLARDMALAIMGPIPNVVVFGLEIWGAMLKEVPTGKPIETDNPIAKTVLRDEEVRLEGAAEYSFGELLAGNVGVVYRWPDVRAGRYELEVVSG
jgi:signal transduction histidine kinase